MLLPMDNSEQTVGPSSDGRHDAEGRRRHVQCSDPWPVIDRYVRGFIIHLLATLFGLAASFSGLLASLLSLSAIVHRFPAGSFGFFADLFRLSDSFGGFIRSCLLWWRLWGDSLEHGN